MANNNHEILRNYHKLELDSIISNWNQKEKLSKKHVEKLWKDLKHDKALKIRMNIILILILSDCSRELQYFYLHRVRLPSLN